MSTQADDRMMQQAQYLGWVNAQLKKKPGANLLSDLSVGMHDGTAFTDLIEVVADYRVPGIVVGPMLSDVDKLSNVERVIAYMKDRHIRMHETSPQDVVAGNPKAIMRLTLALAAYFKPSAVKQSNSSAALNQSDRRSHGMTVIGYTQSAAESLASARKEVGAVIRKPTPPKPPDYSDNSHERPRPSTRTRHDVTSNDVRSANILQKSTSQDFVSRTAVDAELRFRQLSEQYATLNRDHENLCHEHVVLRDVLHEQCELYDESLREIALLRSSLVSLQQLLLESVDINDDSSFTTASEVDIPDPSSSATCASSFLSAKPLSQADAVLLRSRLQHSEEVCRETNEKLSRTYNDALRFQAAEASLQQRLHEQQEELLRVTDELSAATKQCQLLANKQCDSEKILSEHQRLIKELRNSSTLDNTTTDGSGNIKNSSSIESCSSRREGKLLRSISETTRHAIDEEDVESIRESIEDLQRHLPLNGMQSRLALDRLETRFNLLIDRLHEDSNENDVTRHNSSTHEFNNRQSSLVDVRRSNLQGKSRSLVNGHTASLTTKVVSFINDNDAPTMSYINKRLSDIQLIDVKKLLNTVGAGRSGGVPPLTNQRPRRYHFRSQDPEYGLVKEEISNDDAPVPGWEGTVMVWVEDDDKR